jgi:Ion channel
MSPMGLRVNRQAHHVAQHMDDYDDDEYDSRSGRSGETIRPVPIWLCVFLVVSYIIAGAFLFHHWEGWSFLDSAYFCFITLTTIGKSNILTKILILILHQHCRQMLEKLK